jgi:hypothetical protein
MSLATQLSTVLEHFMKNAPDEITKPILSAREDFKQSFDAKAAIQVGDKLP